MRRNFTQEQLDRFERTAAEIRKVSVEIREKMKEAEKKPSNPEAEAEARKLLAVWNQGAWESEHAKW